MRITHLLALAAVAGTAANSATAQESRASAEVRARATAPNVFRIDRWDNGPANRAAIGIGTGTSGTLRDTLGILITSVTRGSPAEKAGLEEGNRIASVNGVNLRVAAVDVEDGEMSGAMTRRLTRELGRAKPGDEVTLSVYRDGRFNTVKIKTVDSEELFGRVETMRTTADRREDRPALGFSIGSTGGKRDTLGVLIMSVADSSPAAKAGLEEGNRIAAINGVNLRVPREDAGDRWLGSTKATRLQREISQLKVGENVTLKVYANGQFRDVTMKVARAGDLPRSSSGFTIIGPDGFGAGMNMPMMPAAPRGEMRMMIPSLPRGGVLRDMPELENLRGRLETIRPQLERMRLEAPRVMSAPRVMVAPRVRVVNVKV